MKLWVRPITRVDRFEKASFPPEREKASSCKNSATLGSRLRRLSRDIISATCCYLKVQKQETAGPSSGVQPMGPSFLAITRLVRGLGGLWERLPVSFFTLFHLPTQHLSKSVRR